MCLENLEVMHKAFGAGVIVGQRGNYFTVRFASCEKVFVYPDIFEKFLTLADGSVTDEILSDLAFAKDKKQQIINKKQEENQRAKTHGIVIPGKEKTETDSEDEESRNKNNSDGEVY